MVLQSKKIPIKGTNLFKLIGKDTLNVKLKTPVGGSKSLVKSD